MLAKVAKQYAAKGEKSFNIGQYESIIIDFVIAIQSIELNSLPFSTARAWSCLYQHGEFQRIRLRSISVSTTSQHRNEPVGFVLLRSDQLSILLQSAGVQFHSTWWL